MDKQEEESRRNLEKIQELENEIESLKNGIKNRNVLSNSVLLNLIGIGVFIYGSADGGIFYIILGVFLVFFSILYLSVKST
tara:strand:- start:240 stop:482 length:243 start_codon:yes stop_codon:yes gene_type:complete